MPQNQDVTPSGPGFRASHGADKSSPPEASIPNAVLRPLHVHGYEVTKEQILAGLNAMVGNYRAYDVWKALKGAGVPDAGPFRTGYGTATNYSAAIQLGKRALGAGLVERVSYHGWRSRRRLAQAIEAGTATTAGRGPKDESAVPATSGDAS